MAHSYVGKEVAKDISNGAVFAGYATEYYELELELIQPHMTQKPVLRGEVGACRFTQLTSTAKR